MSTPFFGRWLNRPQKLKLNSSTEEKANPCDAESQFSLGRKFANGEGVPVDYAQAAEWYLKAATQGHCVAQFDLGLMYGQGQGVVRDDAKALLWLHNSADRGHAGAQYHVGVRQHRAGRSGRQGESSECRIEAFKWLQLAVAQGYRGSESAQEFVALTMTREEVDEGCRRAQAFSLALAQPAS
jgi:TPR repeat protein